MTETATKPSPGWYADKARPGFDRYWTGSTWTEERRETAVEMSFFERAGFLFFAGLLIAALTGLLGAALGGDSATDVVWIVGGVISGLMLQIATIALGVDLGIRMSKRAR